MTITTVVRRVLASAAAAAIAVAVLASAGPAVAKPSGLHSTGSVKLGASVSSFTEAPDGVVYYSAGSSVYSVTGTSTPVLAVHAGGTVLAVAAGAKELFVAVGRTVTEYSRSNGAKGRQWKLGIQTKNKTTSAGLYAVGSTVWGWTDWSTDETGFEYATVSRFTTSSAAVHKVSSGIAYPADMAANSAGLYYQAVKVNGTNGYLTRVTRSGSVRRVTDVNLDGPLALAGGRVEVLADHLRHGKVHLYIDSFEETTLAHVYSRPVSMADRDIAGTGDGLILISASCQSFICSSAKVSRLSTATGAVTATITVPDAFTALAGPSAAVLTYQGGNYSLVRLAG